MINLYNIFQRFLQEHFRFSESIYTIIYEIILLNLVVDLLDYHDFINLIQVKFLHLLNRKRKEYLQLKLK